MHKSRKCTFSNKMNPNRPMPRHIITTILKVKDKENLKSGKRKTGTYKGAPIRLLADFSTETLQARRDWCEMFKVRKSKDL